MHVVTYLPHGAMPDIRGFAPAIVAWNIAKYLSFSTTSMICAAEHDTRPKEIIEGMSIHRLRQSDVYTRLFNKITRMDPWPLHSRAAKLTRKLAPDLVHAHQLEFPVNSFKNQLHKDIPIVVHAHVSNRRFDSKRGAADRYIAVSVHVKRMLLEKGYPEAAVEVIPNGVDIHCFAPPAPDEKSELRQILNIPLSATVITFAGRKQEVKGFHTFLGAAAQLLKKYPDLYIIAVGSEPADSDREHSYPSRQRVRQALSKNPNFLDLPALPHHLLANVLKLSDITLLPSLHEPQGMLMLESMAAGCITISTNTGGIAESIINGVTGYLLDDPSDINLAADKVELVLSHLANLDGMRAAARRRVEEIFDWKVISRKIEHLYFSLASEK